MVLSKIGCRVLYRRLTPKLHRLLLHRANVRHLNQVVQGGIAVIINCIEGDIAALSVAFVLVHN